jgi:hypothetical protein
MHISFAVALSLVGGLLSAGCHSSPKRVDQRPSESADVTTLIQSTDFDLLAGPVWSGTLTYLDYTSNKSTTIRSTLLVKSISPGVWTWATGYNDEPDANSSSEVRVIEKGAAIQSGDTIERVLSRIYDGDHVEITTEHADIDNKRPATIQRVYDIAPGRFSIRKLVKVEGEGEFFERHVYNWSR